MGWVPINGLMLPSLGNIQWASSSTYWVMDATGEKDKADRLHGEVSEMLQAVSDGLGMLQQGQFSIAEALMQMNAANHAPKRIAVVRDAKGRVAGAEEVAT